jgi:pimeloyl-ACP methyl ester carboxylesterase
MNHFRLSFRLWALVVLLLPAVESCKPGDPQPEPDQYLVSSTLIGEFSKEQLNNRLGAFGQVAALTRYGIQAHRIVYNTVAVDGTTPIEASGLLLVPVNPVSPLSLVSQQHGTITRNEDAPSLYGASSEAYTFGSLFASIGYFIACPDYIGYGSTSTLPHPYEHAASLATATRDMLRAAKEFIARNNQNWDGKTYLTGYSEGGTATMATHRLIEQQHAGEFNLRAVSCGAGAYDKTAFMQYLINERTHGIADFNASYLWVLLTYDRVYGLNRPASYYFKEPWAAQIQAQRERAVVNVSLNEIFTDAFKEGVRNGTDTGFINAVKANDIYDWTPKAPLHLYHGDADQLVFYFNSKKAYDTMRARGATNVTLTTTPGGTHFSTVTDYLLGTYFFFSSTP